MIPVEYRRADWRERPFLDQAHRVEQPEPLWQAVLVLVAGLAALWLLVNVVLVAAPQ